eukprot:9481195-Pyramimonas_sp.AAC.3
MKWGLNSERTSGGGLVALRGDEPALERQYRSEEGTERALAYCALNWCTPLLSVVVGSLQNTCEEGGCLDDRGCGMHNVTITRVEANRFSFDRPIFDTTKDNVLFFLYDRPYKTRLLLDGVTINVVDENPTLTKVTLAHCHTVRTVITVALRLVHSRAGDGNAA